MPLTLRRYQPDSFLSRINQAVDTSFSFGLSGVSALAISASSFSETLTSARVSLLLAGLLAIHVLVTGRFVLRREVTLYVALLFYMMFALLWTDDVRLALNTIVPAIGFASVLLLYSSLTDMRGALAGGLAGVSTGAILYTIDSGFPFSYPPDFSYNAIAGIYLFGLFISMLMSVYGRHTILWSGLIFVLLGLCLATTSIKVNLGIALGAVVVAIAYFSYCMRAIGRNMISLLVLAALVVTVIALNDTLLRILEAGADRVALGIEILRVQEGLPGYSAFEERQQWLRNGINGWLENPVFGHGVEAFRSRYGITSHSTPIDMAYNYGLVGLILFYSILGSVVYRLIRPSCLSQAQRCVILGAMTCYAFISISAPLYYNAFFAAVVGISTSLLRERSFAGK